MEEAIPAVEEAFRDYSLGLIRVEPRVTMEVRGEANPAIILPAIHQGRQFYGLKQASSFPGNLEQGLPTVFSDIHLYSARTGRPLAVLGAVHLTAIKTGAAAAVAAKYLAPKGKVALAVIGTGVQARTQVAGMGLVRELTEIRLHDRDRARAEKLARDLERKVGPAEVKVFDDPEECVSGAGVVAACTTSFKPVFQDRSLEPGCLVNAVGSFTPRMQEIDAETVARADKVVTDVASETWRAAGDLLAALEEGRITRDRIDAELGDIVAGKRPGRERPEELILYESVGFGALDIALAGALYLRAEEEGFGTVVEW
jgi:ornithine cyclodeaminase/alanine dehydrogenase-like protein (mu-crystallin family)